MVHQGKRRLKRVWTYDSSVNKDPEICWQLVLCPSLKQLALAREKLCGTGQILTEWVQDRQFLCSFRSQGLVLQTHASWIAVIFKVSSAQVKESVIRLLFVSYLQDFDVLLSFCLPQGMLLTFSYFIFSDSELSMVKWSSSPSFVFFYYFFWPTVFTLVISLTPEAKSRPFLISRCFRGLSIACLITQLITF